MDLLKDEKIIVEYLRAKVLKGHRFFKSKYIAKDIGKSPKQVGTILGKLRQKEDLKHIKIMEWSTTSSITWRIDPV